MEYRDGKATGRLIDPIVRPRGPLAWLASGGSDGRIAREKLSSQLGWAKKPEQLESAMQTTARSAIPPGKSVTLFGENSASQETFCRENLEKRI